MATQALASTVGERWATFLRKFPYIPQLSGAAHTENQTEFTNFIKRFLPPEYIATTDFAGLWKDVDALRKLHEEDHTQKPHREHTEDISHDQSHDTHSESADGLVETLLSLPGNPKFMEEDPNFWKLLDEEQKIWNENHPPPDKNASEEEKLAYEQEALDFTYGSLDDDTNPSLQQLTAQRFEAEYGQQEALNTNAADTTTKIPINQKNLKSWKKYVEYKKTPTSFKKDQEVWYTNYRITQEAQARYALLEKSGLKGTELDQSYKAVMERIKKKRWEQFFEQHPEKTAAYIQEKNKPSVSKHEQEIFEEFKKFHEEWQQQQITKKTTTPSPPPPSSLPKTTEKEAVAATEEIVRPLTDADKSAAVTTATTIMRSPASVVSPTAPSGIKKTEERDLTEALLGSHPVNTDAKLYGGKHGAKGTPIAPSVHPAPPSPSLQSQTRNKPAPSQTHPPPGSKQQSSRFKIPGFSFSFPRRRTTASRPLPSLPRRRGMLDRLNNGLSSGSNMLQNGMNAAQGLRNLIASARFFAFMGPLPWVIAILVIIGVIAWISAVSSTPRMNLSKPPTPTPSPNQTGIPGLTLTLIGPVAVPNSENISYTIDVAYTGNGDVVLSDPLPPNTKYVNATGTFEIDGTTLQDSQNIKWRLKDNNGDASSSSPLPTPDPRVLAATDAPFSPTPPASTQEAKNYRFTIILAPQKEDIEVKNKIVATSEEPVLTPGTPGTVLTGGSGNACTQQYEGTGYCSVENLKQYFDGDASKALVASMICQTESSSNPNSMNTNCGTNDYSIGLFQINLVAHCAGAYGGLSCNNLIDINKRNVCEAQYKNPEENIRYMVKLSQNGTKWTDWSAYTSSSIGVRKRLAECGIN